jgi:hypothetical protein
MEIGISMKDNFNELMNGLRGTFSASYPLEEREIHEMFEYIERELEDMQEQMWFIIRTLQESLMLE